MCLKSKSDLKEFVSSALKSNITEYFNKIKLFNLYISCVEKDSIKFEYDVTEETIFEEHSKLIFDTIYRIKLIIRYINSENNQIYSNNILLPEKYSSYKEAKKTIEFYKNFSE